MAARIFWNFLFDTLQHQLFLGRSTLPNTYASFWKLKYSSPLPTVCFKYLWFSINHCVSPIYRDCNSVLSNSLYIIILLCFFIVFGVIYLMLARSSTGPNLVPHKSWWSHEIWREIKICLQGTARTWHKWGYLVMTMIWVPEIHLLTKSIVSQYDSYKYFYKVISHQPWISSIHPLHLYPVLPTAVFGFIYPWLLICVHTVNN
jgi:hypothetical protein